MTGFDHPENAPRLLGAVTVALTAAAGALDAVTFFAFNEVFASTMTGNLILLGLDIGRGRWFATIEALCAIGGYSAGLVVGTLVAGVTMRRLPWRHAVGVALTVELALLIAVGVGWHASDGAVGNTVRSVLLVVGAAVAMGVQAAALRYVGPGGTPTNFLTGTVTNWVSAMVELHRPRFDGNSALRIAAVGVAAGLGAVIQMKAPTYTYVLPVAMVALAVALMARVVRLNHGGLTVGEAQFRDHVRERDERETLPRDAEGPVSGSDPGDARGPLVTGRVVDLGGGGRPAVVTLLDLEGVAVGRTQSAPDGRYVLTAGRPGLYTVLCSPQGVARPRASVIDVGIDPTVHDVVLSFADEQTRAPS